MSRAGSQQRTVLELLAALRPHWHRDRALPARIQQLLARRRAFGSRDRRLYRELIYTALRYLPWIERHLDSAPEFAVQLLAWLAADAPATAHFRTEVLTDWPSCPATTAGKVALLHSRAAAVAALAPTEPTTDELLPRWFVEACPQALAPEQLDALLARAPLWLRLRRPQDETVTAEFAALGWHARPSAICSTAWQVLEAADVIRTAAFRDGRFEVQDLGSQLLLHSASIAPDSRWLDACAGAGGKTLQLADRVGPAGRVDAFDVRRSALAELAVRASRAGASWVKVLVDPPTESYDGVLVDAPCSGSGTWRRAPHLKWTTTPAHIAAAAERQSTLLEEFSARVRPGGQLIYATCSLCPQENDAVVAAFLARHLEFAAEQPARDFGARLGAHGLTFLPSVHDTDGFFVAHLRRRS